MAAQAASTAWSAPLAGLSTIAMWMPGSDPSSRVRAPMLSTLHPAGTVNVAPPGVECRVSTSTRLAAGLSCGVGGGVVVVAGGLACAAGGGALVLAVGSDLV